jgi:N-acetylglucosamine-6-sulfatase
LINAYKIAGRPFKHIVNRLDALLLVLKSCKGWECIDPWAVLHPRGNIKTLKDALASDFDTFYHEQPKVSYSKCELGYIKDSEGPQIANVLGEDLIGPQTHLEFKRNIKSFEYQGHWALYA